MALKVVILLIVLYTILQEVRPASICSECVCPAEYDPICTRQQATGKLRGFSNMCVMNCTNMCAKYKYEFFKKGRCGTRGAQRVTVSTGGDSSRTTTTTTWRPLLFGKK